MASLEQIGTVTTRSGGLIVIDTGYLGIWSHSAPPLLPEGSLDTKEQTSRANSFVDLRLVGSDAERAGQLLDMSWNPLFVYDQPVAHPELEQKLREVVRKHDRDARFEVISPRIPHRRRINQAVRAWPWCWRDSVSRCVGCCGQWRTCRRVPTCVRGTHASTRPIQLEACLGSL